MWTVWVKNIICICTDRFHFRGAVFIKEEGILKKKVEIPIYEIIKMD
jgi:hypothetical protein